MTRLDSGRWRRLDLQVTRRVDGLLQGDHTGLRLGPGGEREELARYQPGDDPRRIDWNVTARASDLHVWRTRADHELDTWVLVDETASMAFGTAEREKRDVAVDLAASVGLLTDAPGDRLGVATLDADGLRWTRPLPGRTAARALLTAASAPPRDGVPPLSLADALTALRRRAPRPGLRIVVSDLSDEDLSADGEAIPRWERPLRRLAARHDVLVVQIGDPREWELPAVGHLVLVDPESGAQHRVWTGDRKLRRRYADAARQQAAATAAAVRRARAEHLVLTTDRDWTHDLVAHLRARTARRGARRPVRRTS